MQKKGGIITKEEQNLKHPVLSQLIINMRQHHQKEVGERERERVNLIYYLVKISEFTG